MCDDILLKKKKNQNQFPLDWVRLQQKRQTKCIFSFPFSASFFDATMLFVLIFFSTQCCCEASSDTHFELVTWGSREVVCCAFADFAAPAGRRCLTRPVFYFWPVYFTALLVVLELELLRASDTALSCCKKLGALHDHTVCHAKHPPSRTAGPGSSLRVTTSMAELVIAFSPSLTPVKETVVKSIPLDTSSLNW